MNHARRLLEATPYVVTAVEDPPCHTILFRSNTTTRYGCGEEAFRKSKEVLYRAANVLHWRMGEKIPIMGLKPPNVGLRRFMRSSFLKKNTSDEVVHSASDP